MVSELSENTNLIQSVGKRTNVLVHALAQIKHFYMLWISMTEVTYTFAFNPTIKWMNSHVNAKAAFLSPQG